MAIPKIAAAPVAAPVAAAAAPVAVATPYVAPVAAVTATYSGVGGTFGYGYGAVGAVGVVRHRFVGGRAVVAVVGRPAVVRRAGVVVRVRR